MRTELFGEMREGRDGEMGEEMRGCFEEDLEGLVKAAEVGIWSCAHFIYSVQSCVFVQSRYRSSTLRYSMPRPKQSRKTLRRRLPLFFQSSSPLAKEPRFSFAGFYILSSCHLGQLTCSWFRDGQVNQYDRDSDQASE